MKKYIFLAAVLSSCITCPIGARPSVTFGSKGSSIVVDDGSAFNIVPDIVSFDGGTFNNTGYGVVSGGDMYLKYGAYSYFNSNSDFTGRINTSSNTIQLGSNPLTGGDTMIANPGGLAGVQVKAVPGENILRGQPLFFGENDLVIADESSLLNVAIQNTVNTNVTLNGGVLRLQDDLRFGDNAIINDSGWVLLNNRRISLGGQSAQWPGSIIWLAAQDLQLNSAINLTGNWLFSGEGQINGNGNVLDIAQGGQILVASESTLRLSSVQLKGLGALGKIRLSQSATLILSDVVIEMADDYTVQSGTWRIEGSSRVITKDKILTFGDGPSGFKGKLVVDRVDFTYDTLATLDRLNIQPALILDPLREHIEIIGNGEIGTIKRDTVTFHNYKSESLLQKYAIVAPYRKFQVYPELLEDSSLNYDVLIDGNSNFLGFTRTDEQVFLINENVQARTENIIMRDLSPKHISIAQGASLVFGNKTMITLSRNEYLDYPWHFQGNTILKGGGSVLELGPNGAIIVEGAAASLLLDGLIIKGLNGNNIRCTGDSNTIQMRGVKLVSSGDFNFAHGAIHLVDDVTITGPHAFRYQSGDAFAILNNATLYLTRDAKFVHDSQAGPNTFTFEDGSAALQLDGATFSSENPLTLAGGRFILRNQNYISQNITLDPSLTIDLSGELLKL
jgi:hypothetical protein